MSCDKNVDKGQGKKFESQKNVDSDETLQELQELPFASVMESQF